MGNPHFLRRSYGIALFGRLEGNRDLRMGGKHPAEHLLDLPFEMRSEVLIIHYLVLSMREYGNEWRCCLAFVSSPVQVWSKMGVVFVGSESMQS